MKKETLEEAAERYSDGKSSSDVFKKAHITDFIEGAKSDAAREMWYNEFRKTHYSEVEVIQFVNWLGENRCLDDTCKSNIGWVFFIKNEKGKDFKPTKELLKKWFEQFKKK